MPDVGPIKDLKTQVAALMTQASSAQTTIMGLKKKLSVAKVDFVKKEQAERNAHLWAKEQQEVDVIMNPAKEVISALEACMKALEEATSPLTSLDEDSLQDFPSPSAVLEEARKLGATAQESVVAARSKLKEQQGKLNSEPKKIAGPLVDARKSIISMMAQVEHSNRQVDKTINSVRDKCEAITTSLSQRCAAALRATGKANEEIFSEWASPVDERIPEEMMKNQLLALPDVGIKPEHAALICKQIAVGSIGKFQFMRFMERYYVVSRSSVMTQDFDIKAGKVMRKVDLDEIVELVEGPRIDEKVGLTRIKARSLKDSMVGWISVKGNQGSPFLDELEKPYYVCAVGTELQADAKGNAEAPVRSILAGEVVELIEGPSRERLKANVRARGKAVADNQAGWVTVVSNRGQTLLEEGKFYITSATVELTDELDLSKAQVMRKLKPGEVLTGLDMMGEHEGVPRMRFRTTKDAMEGWVSMKLPTGQKLVNESNKCYTALEDTAIQRTESATNSAVARTLHKGEVFQVLDGPKEESTAQALRAKVKAVADGSVGWISLGPQTPLWTPQYVVRQGVSLDDGISAEHSSELRELAVGEVIELLEGPKMDAGTLRMRGRAVTDGAIGWATINDEGEMMVEPKPIPGRKR
jgi:hypothetical protein